MTDTNTSIEHDFTYTDTADYTLVCWRDLTQLDRKQNPDYMICINAILKSDDAEKERPFLLAWYYNEKTGGYVCGEHFKTLTDAMDELEKHNDCICPIKVLANSKNTACDFDDCAWYVKDDDACAFTAQTQVLNEVRGIYELIPDRLAGIDDTLACQ